MRLVLGLDIGITSVGWGIIDIDSNKVVDYGVRLFKEGTAEKNEDRRGARGRRRLISRKRTRITDCKKYLKSIGIIQDVNAFEPLANPYQIRVKGLSQKLTNDQLATAILHIIKRRGSSLESVEDDEKKAKELGETKKALKENDKLLAQNHFVCEIQLMNLEKLGKIHGDMNNFRTQAYVSEIKQILENQNLKKEQKDQIISFVDRRRAYYEGPGSYKSPTMYGRFIEENGSIKEINLIEKMRGHCSIYPTELRAPKMAFSADLFNLLNDLNNLTIQGEEKLTQEQKAQIIEIVKSKGGITPLQLAKFLGYSIDEITGFRIDKSNKQLLTEFKGYKNIKKALSSIGQLQHLDDIEFIDQVVNILTQTKGIEERNSFQH